MEVLTNMAGNVWKVVVQPGDQVTEGQDVVILESMKMEIPISAEVSGIVDEVIVNEGDFVNDGDVVIKLK
ncbi:acetyl-CoA carboxylase biotin carboxyl carrier protein subunit [Niallia endozanthoxylica]|uniref:Acetyl-CoA carboxylase biotin carboxyl carrier protein subunit n=1 Tax=Niallia endozanthoxylica TaxID=2036016 RepID=A0A5J5HW60_9BACI|nr:acetyl-CoA carboxylase biotin carboxyl carrier protein subunit [Niallia endozanthoxylica]KAA9027057.1 acetyl-CoA carboxylase biotin carboxyl carrier protein subunit [Niallia endozanthoxylica]